MPHICPAVSTEYNVGIPADTGEVSEHRGPFSAHRDCSLSHASREGGGLDDESDDADEIPELTDGSSDEEPWVLVNNGLNASHPAAAEPAEETELPEDEVLPEKILPPVPDFPVPASR